MALNNLLRAVATARGDVRWRASGGGGVAAQSAVVAGVVAVVWFGVAPLAYGLTGGAGLATAGLAAAVALVAAQLALAASRLFRGAQAPMYGMLTGMIIRMTIALAAVVALRAKAAPVADAPLILYLVLFYLATLATETVLLVADIQPHAAPRKTV